MGNNKKFADVLSLSSFISLILAFVFICFDIVIASFNEPGSYRMEGPFSFVCIMMLLAFGLAFVFGLISIFYCYVKKQKGKWFKYAIISTLTSFILGVLVLSAMFITYGIAKVREENRTQTTTIEKTE